MTTTRERIEQAEESLAQLQSVLDHTQSALAVAEQVEAAARKSRRLLKFLLVIAVVGVAIAIVMKVTRSGEDGSDTDPDGSSDGS
jgi:ferric-dicitrate binding protein FerR (iron transport regulator)